MLYAGISPTSDVLTVLSLEDVFGGISTIGGYYKVGGGGGGGG
jgi:hypothetical protein